MDYSTGLLLYCIKREPQREHVQYTGACIVYTGIYWSHLYVVPVFVLFFVLNNVISFHALIKIHTPCRYVNFRDYQL